MSWPGENLIIKLLETLADKGIGGLLRPGQIRREGAARSDVKRLEVLAIAMAEKEALEIKEGKRKLVETQFVISQTSELIDSNEKNLPEKITATQIATQSVIADTLRKEINVANAITCAEDELRSDESPISEDEIEADWLFRWRDCAGEVSTEGLQAIWGRILAGELKSPGVYSFRLLEFVKNLNKNEARLIERISPFVIKDIVARKPDSVLIDHGITLDILLQLQELGVIYNVDASALSKTYPSVSSEAYSYFLQCHGRGILIENSNPQKELMIEVYPVTSLGKQVILLAASEPNEDYLVTVAREIEKDGFTISLCDYFEIAENKVRIHNKKIISGKPN